MAIIVYGFSFMRYAGKQLFSIFTEGPDAVLFRYMLLNLNIGLVTFILGVGLLFAKEWARIAWLMCAIALVVLHTVALFLASESNRTLPFLNLVVIVLLFLISWVKLTRPSVKELFS